MGRLNYTNRKSEGVKLGQVCAKDLTKRIPPAPGSRAAQRDPVVEIDISSKSLTDEGFWELTQALVDSIRYKGEHGKIVRLEELCLKDNGLTPASLKHLSRVVQLACEDLRDLDLSNNHICIRTPEEIAAWEGFLRSFSRCVVLRKLDLSGNRLGTKAFEVLTRIYSGEQPIDIVLPEHLDSVGHREVGSWTAVPRDPSGLECKARRMSIVSESETSTGHDVDKVGGALGKCKATRKGSKSPEKSEVSGAEAAQFLVYATTKGLRSVPYIVLSDTSMDEASALHLSYILTTHRAPDWLLTRVPPAKPGFHTQQLLSYGSETRCRGIIYLPNTRLSNAGNRVLDLAEKVRDGRQDLLASSSNGGHNASEHQEDGANSENEGKYPATRHRRRSSAITGEATRESVVSDLDRARSRLQGNTIETAGHQSNDLWRMALKMLIMSREIQPQKANDPPLPPPSPQQPPKSKPPIVRTLEIPGITPKKGNVWGIPLGIKSSNQTMSPRPSRIRKDSLSIPPPTSMASTIPTIVPSEVELRRPQMPDKAYRSQLPCGFSEDAWSRIMGFVTGADRLLSHGQQRSVLLYAMDRGTLRKERDSLGLKEAAQIWHVLEGMGCLAYEMR